MSSRVNKAQELGLQVTSTTENGLTTSVISIPDLPTFKQILDVGTTYASRETLVRRMFEGVQAVGSPENDGTVDGTLRRIEEYLFGNAELSSLDARRAASQFPQEYTIVTGAPTGPLTTEWCIGTKQGLQTYCLDSLDIEDGGYITAYATPIELTITSLTRNGAAPPGWSDFNIYGYTGDAGAPVGGVAAAAQGNTGNGGTCTVSGSEPGDNGGDGSTGTTGSVGDTGNTGGAGYASCTATITIKGLNGNASTLTFFNQSGTGGTGGQGGQGGAGGTGGKGGDGATCECTGTSGGRGGNGGGGGTGGIGGTGGVGTSATGNVTVNVPASLLNSILGKTASAPPGPGGAGGAPGAGGNPGNGGAGGKGHGSPGSGTKGTLGPTGPTGPTGASSGLPGQFIKGTI
jgi:hypothetical protein